MLGRFDYDKISKSILCSLRTVKTKSKSKYLFDTKMDASLRVRDCVMMRGTDKYYMIEEGNLEPNGKLFKQIYN